MQFSGILKTFESLKIGCRSWKDTPSYIYTNSTMDIHDINDKSHIGSVDVKGNEHKAHQLRL